MQGIGACVSAKSRAIAPRLSDHYTVMSGGFGLHIPRKFPASSIGLRIAAARGLYIQ